LPDKTQLNEELYEEAKLSNESTPRENEDIAIILSERPPKAINIKSIARTSKSGDVYLTMQVSVNESRINAESDKKKVNMTKQSMMKRDVEIIEYRATSDQSNLRRLTT